MSAVTIAINLIATDGTNAAFSAFSSTMTGTAAKLQGFRGLLRDVNPEFAALGAGLVASAAAFELFKIPVQDGIQAASDLEQALTRLKFATQENASDMPLLTAAVTDLAVKTMFGVTDATQAFERLNEMGFNTQQIMYGMDDSANALMDGAYHAQEATHGLGMESLFLGQALKADAVDGAQLLGATLHTFEADGMSAATAANYLAAAFFNGVPNVQMLEEAIRNGGSTAVSVGVNFRDFAITLDLLSQAGLPAGMAATSLNYFLTQLSSPTTKAAKAMAELGLITIDTGPKFDAFAAALSRSGAAGAGAVHDFDGTVTSLQRMFKAGQDAGLISLDATFNSWAIQAGIMNNQLFDANGKFIGMKDAAMLLQDALGGVDNKAAKLGYIRDIFNIRGGQAARLLSLMDEFGLKYDQVAARFDKTDLGKLAADQLNTLAGAIDQLKDTFTSTLATAFLPILPVFTDLVQHVTELVSAFQNLDPNVKTSIAVVLVVLTVFTGLTTVILGVIVAVAGFVAILMTAGIPIGAVLAGLGAMVVLIAQVAGTAGVLALNWGTVQQVFNLLGQGLSAVGDLFKRFGTSFNDAMSAVGGNTILKRIGDFIGGTFNQVVQTMAGLWKDKVEPAFKGVGDALSGLKPILDNLGPIFENIGFMLGTVFGALLNFFAPVIESIVGLLGGLFMGISAFVGGILQALGGLIEFLVGLFQATFGAVFMLIAGKPQEAWKMVQDGLGHMKDGILNLLGGLVLAILGLLSGLVAGAVGWVTGLVHGIIDWFQNLFDTLVGHSIVPDMVKAILDWIGNLVSMVLSFIGDLVTRVVTFFLSLGIRVLAAVNYMVNLVLHTIRGWVASILKLANDMVDGFLGFIASLPTKAESTFLTLVANTQKLVTDLKNLGLDAANGLINNLVSGLQNGISKIKEVVGNIAGVIGSVLHHSVPEEGPLRDDDQWGGHLVDNLVVGMQGRIPNLASAANQVASAIRGPINTPQFGASGAGNAGVIVINIPLDGKQIAQYTIDLASRQVRQMGASRYAR